jgi:hypothetical protein
MSSSNNAQCVFEIMQSLFSRASVIRARRVELAKGLNRYYLYEMDPDECRCALREDDDIVQQIRILHRYVDNVMVMYIYGAEKYHDIVDKLVSTPELPFTGYMYHPTRGRRITR